MTAGERLIPAAAERGVTVMIHRAFGKGSYFGRIGGRPLPDWAADFRCESWAQFSLKYILGHPDVTGVLAATSNPEHMCANARAGCGPLAGRRGPQAYRRVLAVDPGGAQSASAVRFSSAGTSPGLYSPTCSRFTGSIGCAVMMKRSLPCKNSR